MSSKHHIYITYHVLNKSNTQHTVATTALQKAG